MASFRVGDAEETRETTDARGGLVSGGAPHGLQSPNFIVPGARLDGGTSGAHYQIIHREAKTLVEGQSYTDEPLLLIATGRERALLGFSERAAKDFQEAVAIRPDDAEVWAWRGRVFAQLGRYGEAAADLARAEELAKSPQQYFDVARMYSFAAGAAGAVKTPPVPDNAAAYREAWGSQALACLEQAISAGWKDAARLEQERDLETIRSRPEFQKLLETVQRGNDLPR